MHPHTFGANPRLGLSAFCEGLSCAHICFNGTSLVAPRGRAFAQGAASEGLIKTAPPAKFKNYLHVLVEVSDPQDVFPHKPGSFYFIG